MLDGEKFLRELPVLHGKIEMPDYNGVCTGVYLICEKGMGFISIFCTNERKENEIKETSIKKMIGIVSRIITYKLQELLRGDD